MRLNHVELFYALVVAIDSESRRCLRGRGSHMHAVYMQRWLAMARPPVGVADHSLATCKGRPPAGTVGFGQPAGAVGSGQHVRASRQRPARKGLSPAASPTTSRGGGAGRRGGRPLAGRVPTAMGSRRLRRGSDDDGV
ncbi:hypothetical protein BHM03_00059107, partial [Ensete ventricosum]